MSFHKFLVGEVVMQLIENLLVKERGQCLEITCIPIVEGPILKRD
jgi:hypothetical protein